jgi:molybdopterin converting factor small subunit
VIWRVLTLLALVLAFSEKLPAALNPFCENKLQVVYQNPNYYTDELKNLPFKYTGLLRDVAEAQRFTPVSDVERSTIRGRLRNLVTGIRKTLEKQPDDVVESLMDDLIQAKVQTDRTTLGYIRHPGYESLSELKEEISKGDTVRFLNVLFQSQTQMNGLLDNYDAKSYDYGVLQVFEKALPNVYEALLVREYAQRTLRDKPDMQFPEGGGSVHHVFDSIDDRLKLVFP